MTPAEIKAARKALGLTQRQIAEALDLSSSRVIRGWESGEYVPSRRSVRDLERLLASSAPHAAPHTRKAAETLGD